MTFGDAVEYAKDGHLIAREGWNGKGMFVFTRPEAVVGLAPIKSIPDNVKAWYLARGIEEAKFTAYLCMKAADNTIVNGWLASQTDILADDWVTVEVPPAPYCI